PDAPPAERETGRGPPPVPWGRGRRSTGSVLELTKIRLLVSTPERRLLLIAFFARAIPAFLVYGTEDVGAWEIWGSMLGSGGNPYTSRFLIAWPPPWLALVSVAMHAAQ